MIFLTRPDCPAELTKELKEELTEEFKANGSSVWKQKFIAKGLLEMSFDKCAFCECRLLEEGKYMQVEHFHPKERYKDEVVEWDNLLPICGRCNPIKNDHDTKKEPIINPTIDIPKHHIYLNRFMMWGKEDSEIGKLTVEILDLNDYEGLVLSRFKIAFGVAKKLKNLLEEVREYDENVHPTSHKKTRIKNMIRDLFVEGTPPAEYSAVVATEIISFPYFDELKTTMVSKGMWDTTDSQLENQIREIAFDTR